MIKTCFTHTKTVLPKNLSYKVFHGIEWIIWICRQFLNLSNISSFKHLRENAILYSFCSISYLFPCKVSFKWMKNTVFQSFIDLLPNRTILLLQPAYLFFQSFILFHRSIQGSFLHLGGWRCWSCCCWFWGCGDTWWWGPEFSWVLSSQTKYLQVSWHSIITTTGFTKTQHLNQESANSFFLTDLRNVNTCFFFWECVSSKWKWHQKSSKVWISFRFRIVWLWGRPFLT